MGFEFSALRMEAQGKFQFMEGSWKMAEMPKYIDVKQLGSLPKEALFQFKVNVDKLTEAMKEANEKMANMLGEWKWNPEPLGYQVASNLARCMAKIYGPHDVSMDWHHNLASAFTVIVIRVEGTHLMPQQQAQWAFQFTDEFIFSVEKQSNLTVEQCVFLELLPKMCDHFDYDFKLTFALPPTKMAWEPSEPWDVGFNKTTSSYEYLTKIRFVEKVLRAWRVKNNGGSVMQSFLEETQFKESNILNVPTFNTGGFVQAPSMWEDKQLSDSGRLMKNICPGLAEIVQAPCGCKQPGTVFPLKGMLSKIIIHLNDDIIHGGVSKEWTREEIADWLESLDIDLTLKDNSSTTEKEN